MKLLSITEFVNERYMPSYKNSHVILEGGAYGHMSHPFEDFSLTFAQVKDIIQNSLQGTLDKEIKPVEKLDGVAIAISWKNGSLIASRNKGDRSGFGANALSINDVIDKFKNHPPALRDAFTFAVQDLQSALRKLKQSDLQDIFNEGHNYMHLEVLWPESPNVITYDTSRLIFHTVTEYDEKGNAINNFPEYARKLEKIIKSVNAHIQKNFEITPPIAVKLPKHVDFSKKQSYFLKKVDKIKSAAKLSDTDKIGDYIEEKFKALLLEKDEDSELTPTIMSGLINRWATSNKGYTVRMIKKDIQNQNFLNWILAFDKKEAAKKLKEFIFPLEILFLELGSTILKNASGFLAANPETTVQKIRKDLETAIKKIESSGDVTMINTLQQHMAKIDSIGGFESIVPTEGIVFVYNGKTYKFTGAFAPVNRITGLLKF